jgi:tetratricopeptide (TPR) repeat protein
MDDYSVMLAKAKEINDEAAQMRALNGNGALHASHHNFAQASEFFQQALAVARHIGDERGIAETLNQLGNFYYEMGELSLATKCYSESHDLSLNLNNEAGRITSEDGLAKIILEQGEIAASLKRYEEEILPVRRRLGYRGGLMSSLTSILVAKIYLADYKGAEETAQELLELHKKSGDIYRIPLVKFYQALGQLYQGYLDKAGENFTEGLRLAQEQKQKSSAAVGLAWLGYYYLTLGMDEAGLKEAEKSIELAQELGSPLYVMKAQSVLGTAYRHLGRLAEAVQELESVHTVASDMGFVVDEVMILYQLTRAYMDSGQWEKAEESLETLLDLALKCRMQEFIARGQWLRSILETQRQRYDVALDALVHASEVAQEIDSRLTQYLVQIQKAHIYHISSNEAAGRDALIYAQRLQKKLVESLPDETANQTFLSNANALRMQELIQATTKKLTDPH